MGTNDKHKGEGAGAAPGEGAGAAASEGGEGTSEGGAGAEGGGGAEGDAYTTQRSSRSEGDAYTTQRSTRSEGGAEPSQQSARTEGAPPSQRGAPSSQRGAPPSQRGAPSSQRGVPSSQRGVPSSQRSGPPSQRGGPPTERIRARELGDRVLPFTARRLVAGYDLEEETAFDVAPIGPTEPHVDEGEGWVDVAAVSSGQKSATPEDLERQIRELEARLDRMMDKARSEHLAPEPVGHEAGLAPLGSAADPSASRPPTPDPSASRPPTPDPSASRPPTPDPSASDPSALSGVATIGSVGGEAPSPAPALPVTARELLSSEFYLRRWGREAMRSRVEEVDEFGFDPEYEARYKPLFDFLYQTYFRVEVEGIGHIPDDGRCLVVSNHSGGPIPYDGIMLRTAVRREHPRQRELRWLAEDFVYHLPFAGTVMNRLGAVRACQENAERLLGGGRLVGVFPEGVKGIGKLYKERYRLQRFGRGGFIRLCLRTRTPLVPCAIVGAEETNPLLYRVEHLTRALGIPYVPITPTFPALGPLGLVPAPTKWKMRFGEIVRFDQYGPEAADDEILVGRLAERVRATIQGILDQTLAERKSIWFG